MEQRRWTAEELKAMSAADRHQAFLDNVHWTLDDVPEEFLERVRRRTEGRLDEPPAS